MCVLAVQFSFAQKKNKPAHNQTNRMAEALDLNEDQKAKVLEINIEKFAQLNANKKDASKSADEKKAAKKEIFMTARNKYLAVFGKDNFKKWLAYQKQNKK